MRLDLFIRQRLQRQSNAENRWQHDKMIQWNMYNFIEKFIVIIIIAFVMLENFSFGVRVLSADRDKLRKRDKRKIERSKQIIMCTVCDNNKSMDRMLVIWITKHINRLRFKWDASAVIQNVWVNIFGDLPPNWVCFFFLRRLVVIYFLSFALSLSLSILHSLPLSLSVNWSCVRGK